MIKAYIVMIFSLGVAASPVFAAPTTSAAGQLEAVDAAPDSAGRVYDNQAAGRHGVAVSGSAHVGPVSMLKRRPAKEKVVSSASLPGVETKAGGHWSDGRWVEEQNYFDMGFDWVMRPAYEAYASRNPVGFLVGLLYSIIMVVPATIAGLISAIARRPP